jgi:hypothetical protein
MRWVGFGFRFTSLAVDPLLPTNPTTKDTKAHEFTEIQDPLAFPIHGLGPGMVGCVCFQLLTVEAQAYWT